MDKPWTKTGLAEWGRTAGFRTRLIAGGVMYYRKGKSKAAFTIYVRSLSAGYVVEFAFNKDVTDSLVLFRQLSERHPIAPSKTGHAWPRVGMTIFDAAILERIQASMQVSQA